MSLCFYGCGQEAKYRIGKSKTLCCSKSYSSCPEIKRKKSKKMKGRTKKNNESVRITSEKLTGRTKETHEYIRKRSEKISVKKIGRTKENDEGRRITSEKLTGRTKETHESVRRAAEKKRGKTYEELYGEERAKQLKDNHSKKMRGKKTGPRTEEQKRNISKGSIGKNKGKFHTKEWNKNIGNGVAGTPSPKKGKSLEELYGEEKSRRLKENLRKWMKNGHAAYMCSYIVDDSKPENKLFILACKLLPRPIHKYPIYRVGKGKRSYNVDIADSSLGIILEYDGYFHFCDQEHIDYHRKRQQEIEEEGWKFLRYNIFQKFPTLEHLKEDIIKILER